VQQAAQAQLLQCFAGQTEVLAEAHGHDRHGNTVLAGVFILRLEAG